MKDLQENIVPVENQNAGDFYVHKEGSGVRVMFVGNSITKHAPKPQIGWTNDCGMAASSIDKDYVHILERRIGEIDKDAAFGLLQVAHFEHEFADMDPAVYYSQQIKFKPDVVIMFFGANVSKEYDVCENPKRKFGDAFEALRNALDTGKTFFLISDGFYIRPVLDAEKKKVAEKYGDAYADLTDIRAREDSHGKFNHPGDLGMEMIADRFWEILKPEIEKRASR